MRHDPKGSFLRSLGGGKTDISPIGGMACCDRHVNSRQIPVNSRLFARNEAFRGRASALQGSYRTLPPSRVPHGAQNNHSRVPGYLFSTRPPLFPRDPAARGTDTARFPLCRQICRAFKMGAGRRPHSWLAGATQGASCGPWERRAGLRAPLAAQCELCADRGSVGRRAGVAELQQMHSKSPEIAQTNPRMTALCV